jgi:hypothetical protein
MVLMSDDVVGLPSPAPQWIPISKPLSAYQQPPACCQHAHEHGYRRGYYDGYRYALWDASKAGWRPSETLWEQVMRFIDTTLIAWRLRAWRDRDDPVVRKEWAPRFRQETRRRKTSA